MAEITLGRRPAADVRRVKFSLDKNVARVLECAEGEVAAFVQVLVRNGVEFHAWRAADGAVLSALATDA